VKVNGSPRAAEPRSRVAKYAHAVVDDHCRLAYAELLSDERAVTVVAFTERALAFFARHGIEAKRLMTDNAWCYTHSRAFRDLLSKHAIKHLTIEPYRPRTNGKVERSTKRWRANGPMASATAAQNTARPLCHTGYSTTTRAGRTARSELGHRSAAFGTCVGSTPSQPLEESALEPSRR